VAHHQLHDKVIEHMAVSCLNWPGKVGKTTENYTIAYRSHIGNIKICESARFNRHPHNPYIWGSFYLRVPVQSRYATDIPSQLHVHPPNNVFDFTAIKTTQCHKFISLSNSFSSFRRRGRPLFSAGNKRSHCRFQPTVCALENG
jgi:hypothetical protein